LSVAAVISTYNRTRLLIDGALPSVMRQTVPVNEIIIVGDGTEQQTEDELKLISDPRIRYWNRPRQTYPANPEHRWWVAGLEARNFGFRMVRSEWISELDDDDEWTDDHVEILLAEVQTTGADFAYGMSERFFEIGEERREQGREPLGCEACSSGAWIMRSAMGYRYDMGCIERGKPEDCDLLSRIVADGRRWSFVPKVVHRVNPRWDKRR